MVGMGMIAASSFTLRSNKDSVKRMGLRSYQSSELELELKMPKDKDSIHKRGVLKRQITSGAGMVYSSRTVIITAERIRLFQ